VKSILLRLAGNWVVWENAGMPENYEESLVETTVTKQSKRWF
jgi:hypothetical protein